jgi:FixJ family two-component response regulator
VDDDESVRESLPALLRSAGFEVEAYASAEDFMAAGSLARTDCLILDIRMPGMSGPELQRELAVRRPDLPIVLITAHGGEDLRPRFLEEGAVDCLRKPFRGEALLMAVRSALRRT